MAGTATHSGWARGNFNGAMAVRPWMGNVWKVQYADGKILQWGHGREAMDGVAVDDRFGRVFVLQWGHGREAMDGCSGPSRDSAGG